MTALAVQHFGQINSNLTTNESINRGRYSYLAQDGLYSNPFDLGVMSNWRVFMGCAAPELSALTLDDALHFQTHRLREDATPAALSTSTTHSPSHGNSADSTAASDKVKPGSGGAWMERVKERAKRDAALALTTLKAETAAKTGDAALAAAAAEEKAQFDRELRERELQLQQQQRQRQREAEEEDERHSHSSKTGEVAFGRGMMHSLGMDEGDLSEL